MREREFPASPPARVEREPEPEPVPPVAVAAADGTPQAIGTGYPDEDEDLFGDAAIHDRYEEIKRGEHRTSPSCSR